MIHAHSSLLPVGVLLFLTTAASTAVAAGNPTTVAINPQITYQDCTLPDVGDATCVARVAAVVPAWVHDMTVAAFDNYFEVHICPGADTLSTEEAILRYVELGLPFMDIVENPAPVNLGGQSLRDVTGRLCA